MLNPDKRFLYNNKIFRERRRELRKHQTQAERLLWQELAHNQVWGLRFFRQYGVGPYILDFYCPKIRLAIELDGPSHYSKDAKIYDQERDNYLRSINIKTIRLKNETVVQDTKIAVNKIRQIIPNPPPPKVRGGQEGL